MNSINKQLSVYYSKIEAELVCSKKEKKRLLGELRNSIDLYLRENPEVDMNGIVQYFGSPYEIANSYISTVDGKAINKQYKRHKIVIIVFLIAVLCIIFFSIYNAKSFRSNHPTTINYEFKKYE
jgi:uncharacterized protein DUF6120